MNWYVSAHDLRQSFLVFGIWSQIRNGTLRERVTKTSPGHRGGTSQIVKHYTARGQHVATTHRLLDSGGTETHWDEKDLILPSGDKLCRYP